MFRLAFLACLFAPLSASADPVKIGPLSADPPKAWKAETPSNRLRSFQFKIPSGEEGVPDAEVIVSPQAKPKPDQSFPGWKAQFTPPDGKTIDDVAKESKAEAGGATLHTLDVHGTWKFKERPFDPKSKEEVRPEYRTIWVLAVQKDEATSVRFSGPEKVVEKHKKAFDEFLKALK